MVSLPPANIRSRHFGELPYGRPVEAWTLRGRGGRGGRGGLELEVLTYGAIVSCLRVPDREGMIGRRGIRLRHTGWLPRGLLLSLKDELSVHAAAASVDFPVSFWAMID
jgi:hypothetical protein